MLKLLMQVFICKRLSFLTHQLNLDVKIVCIVFLVVFLHNDIAWDFLIYGLLYLTFPHEADLLALIMSLRLTQYL